MPGSGHGAKEHSKSNSPTFFSVFTLRSLRLCVSILNPETQSEKTVGTAWRRHIMKETNLRGDMNTSLPTVELLEKTHEFPCPYMFKIIGKAGPDFLARVVAIVREELTFEGDPPYRVREAVGGRHVSITLEPVVQSAHQVLAIYRRLGILEGLVMLF
jgi:uncharacterized protein